MEQTATAEVLLSDLQDLQKLLTLIGQHCKEMDHQQGILHQMKLAGWNLEITTYIEQLVALHQKI